jgi:predicted nucleotidyltransferase
MNEGGRSGEPRQIRYHVGTQVVVLRDVLSQGQRTLYPRGAVGVVVSIAGESPVSYGVRFPDETVEVFDPSDLTTLAKFKGGPLSEESTETSLNLYDRVIFKCVIGSVAYGLQTETSDVDRRGIYLAPSQMQWSLYGVPEQLECHETQETYWELQKFLILALKANPNVLESLYSPIVETATPLAAELLANRHLFLSQMIYQTFNGYVMSQFKKMQGDLRNSGKVKWKHVMHLLRLLMSGIHALKENDVLVRLEPSVCETLLEIKRGSVPWTQTESMRKGLHAEFDAAFALTKLPPRPDYEFANDFLIRARRAALNESLP